MDELRKEILVVRRETLFRTRYFTGFLPASEADYYGIVLAQSRYLSRRLAERDPTYKQPIAYAVVVNPARGRVFAYRRASGPSYTESRLRGKWSWAVGGHIERAEADLRDPIRSSLLREISEEVGLRSVENLNILGYINEDDTPVGSVHFGILFVAETSSESLAPQSTEIGESTFLPPEQLADLLADPRCEVERWSEIAWRPVLDYLRGRGASLSGGSSIPK